MVRINTISGYKTAERFFYLLLFAAVSSMASAPVITDLEIIGGPRGIAVSIAADAAFEARFVWSGQATAKIELRNCIYGLNQFVYEKFDTGIPIKKIAVLEKNSSETEIEITLNESVEKTIPAHQKGFQWIGLLTRKGVPEFRWSASEVESYQPRPITQTVTHAQSENAPAGIAELKNIRLLRRDHICELAFEFDREITSKIRRKGDLIEIIFIGARNGSGSSSFTIPGEAVYKKVSLIEKKSSENLLGVSVTLVKGLSDLSFNLAYSRGQVLSLFVMQSGEQKTSLWTSTHGLHWEYDLIEMPDYQVDLKTIGEQAVRDAGADLAEESMFAINDSKVHQADPEQIRAEVQREKTADIPQAAALPQTPVTLVVIADKVNFRSSPSMNSSITGQLTLGDMAEQTGKNRDWVNLRFGNAQGWVHQRFVLDSNHVSDELWRKIEHSKTASAVPVEPAIDPPQQSLALLQVPADIPAKETVKETTGTVPHVIRYTVLGRDPFEPLGRDSLSNKGRPFVEHLKLVGILYDKSDKIALVEDSKNGNRPFALREDDPVEHGKVLKIYRDRIVFLITEYGISRSFTLRLTSTRSEQEVGNR